MCVLHVEDELEVVQRHAGVELAELWAGLVLGELSLPLFKRHWPDLAWEAQQGVTHTLSLKKRRTAAL